MKLILNLVLAMFLTSLTYQVFSQEVKTIKLTTTNHVLLRGEVNDDSVGKMSQKLLQISKNIKSTEPIYLVIDSGGGSVIAGMNFINLMDIVPNPIYTVSLFAFSMAYSISQHGDKRFIANRGIMGQHRAKGGFEGQFATGEVESRLGLFTNIINELEAYEAAKMGITLKEFKSMIVNEMYVYDKEAVTNKVADELVNITCSLKLIETTEDVTTRTFFGSSTSTYSLCPLIKSPIPSSTKKLNFNEVEE